MSHKQGLSVLAVFLLIAVAGCGDGDHRSHSASTPYPTTLEVTLIPAPASPGAAEYTLEEAPGEPWILRDDLQAGQNAGPPSGEPVSLAYLLVLADFQLADEESPSRSSLFDSHKVFFGIFSAAWRPQEDLSPHLLAAVVDAANRIAEGRRRDFDLGLALGDLIDNSQANELRWALDVLDGTGLSSGIPGVCRPDSGALDIDPSTGRNRGERDFGIQEYDAADRPANPFDRPGLPSSNADYEVSGLLRRDGTPLPWFTLLGNHDVLNAGNFDPDAPLGFFTREDYLGSVSRLGFQHGLANMIQFVEENPGQPLLLARGPFHSALDYAPLIRLFNALGLIPDDYREELNPAFDLLALQHETPFDPSDDGVEVAPDPDRGFLGRDGFIRQVHEAGHGFQDNNLDGVVDGRDGGYYSFDLASVCPDRPFPVRFLILDTTDRGDLSEGGISNDQFLWLASELARAIADRVLVIVVSHHTADTILTGSQLLVSLLHTTPNVILHLTGHTHENRVMAMPAKNKDPVYGYWQVGTASTIDFPQQGRILEILDNRDGTGSIRLTLFDHSMDQSEAPEELAVLGRQLAFEDALLAGYDPDAEAGLGGMGAAADRNVELLFAMPESVSQKIAKVR